MQAFDTEKEPVEICENCGTENSCNAKYCKNCGHKLNKFLNWKKIKRENDLFIKYNIKEPDVISFAKNLINGGLNINLDLIKDEKSLVNEIKRAYYE